MGGGIDSAADDVAPHREKKEKEDVKNLNDGLLVGSKV